MKNEHVCLIIYIAISGNRNVIKKKPKIFKKRKIFTTGIQRISTVKTKLYQ